MMSTADSPGESKPTLGKTAVRASRAIAGLIQHGVFAPGEKLPGERQLAERLGVSRGVLRSALTKLEEDGVIESSAWRGWFVHVDRVSEPRALRSFSELAASKGLTATATVVDQRVRASTSREAEALGIAPTATVIETRRVRGLDGIPICVDVSVIPEARAIGLTTVDLQDASLYAALEQACGVRIVRSDYAVHAEAVTAPDAGLLNLNAGDPVLIGEELAFDLSDRAIILGRVVYRGDAYRFEASLFRDA